MDRNHRYGLNGRRCSCHSRHSYAPAGIFAIFALLASFAPTTVLAAEATVNTQQNAIVVFTVIILLLGSVAAGIFFASPLRKRFTGGEPELETEPSRPTEQTRQFIRSSEPMVEYARPSESYAQPTYRPAERQAPQPGPRPVDGYAYPAEAYVPQAPQYAPPVAAPTPAPVVQPQQPFAPQPQAWQPAQATYAPQPQGQPQPQVQPQPQPQVPNFAPTYPPQPAPQAAFPQQPHPQYAQPAPTYQQAPSYPQQMPQQPMVSPQPQPMPQQQPQPQQYQQPQPQRPGSWSSSAPESGPQWGPLPPRR